MTDSITQHHLNNLKEGKEVVNEDGSTSTVKTIIVSDGEHEYLIPTVWDGVILSDDEAFDRALRSGVEWPKAKIGEEGVKILEQLDKKIHEGFKEKSDPMDDQMSFFNEGGMNAPEMPIDPESGNEIPPGSLPEEVRDDIDAQLSEGEYVVPADVLRYHGMKLFEDLRAKAKAGLAKMDEDGRIGGDTGGPNEAPEGLGGEEELSPEEMQMLQQVMSEGEPQMATGGLVGLGNPEFQPGYADGGTVGAELPESTFKPSDWGVGSTVGSLSGASTQGNVGSYYKRFKGPDGTIKMILFIDGKPQAPIPEGFTEVKDAVSEQEEKTAENEAQPADFGGLADHDPDAAALSEEGSNAVGKAMAEDPQGSYSAAMEGLSGKGPSVMGGLAGFGAGLMVGQPALGAKTGSSIGQAFNVATAKANQTYAESVGIEVSDADKAAVAEAQKGLGKVGGWFAGLMADNQVAAATNYKSSLKTPQEATGNPEGETFDSDATFGGMGNVGNSSPSDPSPDPTDGDETGGGQMAKGGFVTRRTKKQPTKKKTTTNTKRTKK